MVTVVRGSSSFFSSFFFSALAEVAALLLTSFSRRQLPGGTADGNHLQADDGILGPADFFHGVAELHVDDVLKEAFPLGHADNFIPHFQAAVQIGGTAGDELLDDAVAVLAGKDGADAHEGEFDADGEVLKGGRAHVAGVGVIKAGEGGEVHLGNLLVVIVLEVFEEAVVALGDGGEGVLFFFLLLFLFRLGRGGGALADQFFPEDVELQTPFPEFLGGGAVGGPVHAGAVDFVGLLGGEVKREGEAALDPGQPFADPVVEAGEDFIGGGDVAALGQFGEDGAVVVLVGLEVAFEEEGVVVVERLHVVADPFPGLFLREGLAGEVVILEKFLHQDGGGLVAGVGQGGGLEVGPRQGNGQGQQEGQPADPYVLESWPHSHLFSLP